jgi:hypothetical protein
MEIIERAGMIISDTLSKLFGDMGNLVSDPMHYCSWTSAL